MRIEDTIFSVTFSEKTMINEATHFPNSNVRVAAHTLIEKGSVLFSNVVVMGACQIGKDCRIGNFSLIRDNVIFGDNVKIGSHNSIEPFARIGSRSRTQGHCMVSEYSTIGEDVFLGPYFNNPADRNPGKPRPEGEYTPEAAIIKDGARIGSHVVVMPGQVVEEETLIGAGSAITKSTGKNQVWFGNPARQIK